jgi:hypothetical protein
VGTDPRTARRNAVLAGLDGTALAAVLPDLRETALSSGGVLHEAGQPIQEVHFPLVGVVSVVADLGADQAVETATVGREGMVGISVFLDSGVPTEQALVQVPGEALTPEDFGRRALSLRGFPPPARHRTPADDLRR